MIMQQKEKYNPERASWIKNYFTGRDGAYVSELLEIPLEGKFREWAIAASAYSLRKHKNNKKSLDFV